MRSRLVINTLLYVGRAMGRRAKDFSRHALGRAALIAVAIAVVAFAQGSTGDAQSAQGPAGGGPASGRDYKHDTSPALRDIPPKPYVGKAEHEANRNPRAVSLHKDEPDTVVQSTPSQPASVQVTIQWILFDRQEGGCV